MRSTACSIIFRLYDRSMQQWARLAMLHQVDVELSASLDQKRVLEAVLAGGTGAFVHDGTDVGRAEWARRSSCCVPAAMAAV